jgi:hypothetical protein
LDVVVVVVVVVDIGVAVFLALLVVFVPSFVFENPPHLEFFS